MSAGTPVRKLPYGRQSIDDADIAAVSAALRGDYLTTGPLVEEFEKSLCAVTGAREAIAVSNGTAALHLAARAAGLSEGTVTVVPAITFLATANAVRLTGGEVVFADVDPDTGSMTPQTLEEALKKIEPGKAKAAIPVHFAGPAADMAGLASVAQKWNIKLIEDAAHAIGTSNDYAESVGDGRYSSMTCFSFHPVKTITTGEGGAITTNDPALARRLRADRCHGMSRDASKFTDRGLGFAPDGNVNPWVYEMQDIGLNYRLTDIQCALGITQLVKLAEFKTARTHIKSIYDELLRSLENAVQPPRTPANAHPAWHLYPVRIDFEKLQCDRATVMRLMANDGIGTQVHYIPLYRQPYYAKRYGAQTLPGAEQHYRETLSLPLYPGMTADDAHAVVKSLRQALGL